MMSDLISHIAALGAWGFRFFWLPLILWSLVALPVYLFARSQRKVSAQLSSLQLRSAVLRALLYGLPAGILLSYLGVWRAVTARVPGSSGASVSAVPESTFLPEIVIETSVPLDLSILPGTLLGLVTLGAGVYGLVQTSRLIAAGVQLQISCFDAAPAPLKVKKLARRMADNYMIRRRLQIRVEPGRGVPRTFGWRVPTIIVPERLTEDSKRLKLALAHEIIHIRRGDYLLGAVEGAIAALFSIYPPVRWIQRELTDLREMLTDAAVLNQTGCRRHEYAELLFDVAARPQAHLWPQTALFGSTSSLEKRIEAMRAWTSNSWNSSSLKRLALTSGTLGFLIIAGLVGCGDLLTPEQQAPVGELRSQENAGHDQRASADPLPRELQINPSSEAEPYESVANMPKLKGGIASIQRHVEYPEAAYEKGIEGTVVVQFIVDTEGHVTNPGIVVGIGGGCDEAAIEAVRQAQFTPGTTESGIKVPVRFSLPVTFRIPDNSS